MLRQKPDIISFTFCGPICLQLCKSTLNISVMLVSSLENGACRNGNIPPLIRAVLSVPFFSRKCEW